MTTYKIDQAHSEIIFKVKHLMISTTSGQFKSFDATLEMDNDNLSTGKVNFTADVNSIDTRNEQRDTHLKSDDFFNAELYPSLTFVSTSIENKDGDTFLVKGNLTIRDTTKPIELLAEYNGVTTDPWGMQRMGFEISGKISRKDYGLKWSALTEAGGVVVADEVKLQMNVEMIKQ